jgi:glycosyltransferase involved in cell wall biosynthesis
MILLSRPQPRLGVSTPLVSVAMPVFNGARFVGAAVESVLSQTLSDFELVVVDDASTDESAETVSRFKDPRIRLFRNQANLGMTGNWNRSVALTEGRYVTMLHQDDLMLPDNLARKVAELESGAVRWVASDCYQIDAQGTRIHEHWFRHHIATAVATRSQLLQFLTMFFVSNYVCFTTIMWERRLMEESGTFNDDGRYCADVHMWLRMLHRARLGYIPERLVLYRWAQNLSLGYNGDQWYIADFLARKAAMRDLDLGLAYSLSLRLRYGAGFVRRVAGHWLGGRKDNARSMLRALRAAVD